MAAYSFNQATGTTVTDASGNNNTATLGSGVSWTTQGRFGSALAFDGTGFVTVPAAASLNLTTGMTLEAWVFPTAAGAGVWRNVIIKEDASREVYNLYSNTDTSAPSTWAVLTSAAHQPHGLYGPGPLPLNAWTHLAATYDGAMLRLYVNGAQVASRALAGPLKTSGGVLRIGGNSIWGEHFQGRIDEIRIYNRARLSLKSRRT